MLTFLTGGLSLLIGALMLETARKYPGRSDVGVLRGAGYVSVACGSIMLLTHAFVVLRWLFV